MVAEVRKFSKAGFGKTDEPLHFDTTRAFMKAHSEKMSRSASVWRA